MTLVMSSTQYIANKGMMKRFLDYKTMVRTIRSRVSITNSRLCQPNLQQTVFAWARLLINSTAYAIPYPIHRFYMENLTQLESLSAL